MEYEKFGRELTIAPVNGAKNLMLIFPKKTLVYEVREMVAKVIEIHETGLGGAEGLLGKGGVMAKIFRRKRGDRILLLDLLGLKLWVKTMDLNVSDGRMMLKTETELELQKSILNYDLFRGSLKIRDVKQFSTRIVVLVQKTGSEYLLEFILPQAGAQVGVNIYGVPESLYMNSNFPSGGDGEMSIADKGFVFATISDSFSNPRQSFCEESINSNRVRKFDVNLWVHAFDPEYKLRVLKIVKDVELAGPVNFDGVGGQLSKNFTNERVDFGIHFERFNINSNLDFVRNSTGQVVLLTSSGLSSQTGVVCDLETLTPQDHFEQHLISNSVQYFYETIFLRSQSSQAPDTAWYEFIQSNLHLILNLQNADSEPVTLKNRILSITLPLSPTQQKDFASLIYQALTQKKDPSTLLILKLFLDLTD